MGHHFLQFSKADIMQLPLLNLYDFNTGFYIRIADLNQNMTTFCKVRFFVCRIKIINTISKFQINQIICRTNLCYLCIMKPITIMKVHSHPLQPTF